MKSKSVMKIVIGTAIFLSMSLTGLAKEAAAAPLFRGYNPNTGEHLYTSSNEELPHLVTVGWKDEGIAWYSPKAGASTYRLYNPNNGGDHHYTSDIGEINFLKNAGWTFEGESFKSGGDVPVYRLYNPNAITGAHHFTIDAGEKDFLVANGWKDEGIGFYSNGNQEFQNLPLIISHQGDAINYPSESYGSYISAVNQKVDYIEFDLRKTKDDVLILHHDGNLIRMTGQDKEIKDYNYNEISHIGLLDAQGNETNEYIPTLEGMFQKFGNTTKYYIQLDYIDHNDTRVNDIPDRAIQLAKANNIKKENIIFQAWKWETLNRAYEIDSSYQYVRLGYSAPLEHEIPLLKEKNMGVGMLNTTVTSDAIKKLQDNGIFVHVYFYDKNLEVNDIGNLARLGVDGLFTDYISDTKRILNR